MSLNCQELLEWADQQPISRSKRNIYRDFSDAIPLVEILKHYYPKLVEVHNYSAKNSFADKLINWQTLNRKVLKKLKLTLTEDTMEKLAKCEPGVIEKVLFDVKKLIEAKAAGDEESRKNRIAQNNLVAKTLEKLESDVEEKEDAINVLKKKVNHLETLLKLKEDRIIELTEKIEKLSSTTNKTFFQKFF